MNRIEDRDDEIVELGIASEETKGQGQTMADFPQLGQPIAGILDD
jgi:hypothetical protein